MPTAESKAQKRPRHLDGSPAKVYDGRVASAPPATSRGTRVRPHLPGFGAGLAVATIVYLGYLSFGPQSTPRVTSVERPTLPPVVVQVVGEVASPGVLRLPAGSRVEEALNAAGGPLEDADPQALNLAARLTDGQRIVVPRKGERPVTADPAPSDGRGVAPAPPSKPAKVNLNTASPAELDTLPGVGPVIAQRIVEQRQKAWFTSPDQLLELKLVNQPTFARLRDLVTVD